MSKRELEQLSGATEMEGPRTKRRRETAAVSTDVEAPHSDPITEGGDEIVSDARKEDVYELGLKMYDTVKDAVNKECVQQSCLIRLFSFRLLLQHQSDILSLHKGVEHCLWFSIAGHRNDSIQTIIKSFSTLLHLKTLRNSSTMARIRPLRQSNKTSSSVSIMQSSTT